MNPDDITVVANWKMQLSFNELLAFCSEHEEHFINLSKKIPKVRIVLCPSFPALYPITRIFKESDIAIGAQDCSQFRSGPYTGQVCAESLSQVGCHYCIIGHSERRLYNHETDEDIAEKVQRLLEQELQPIICVGETEEEYEQKKVFTILRQQLKPILERILNFRLTEESIYIAYEPIWSIGTGLVPEIGYLSEIFGWLFKHIREVLGKDRIVKFLYGGSVSEQTASEFRVARGISGFLVGGASLDFQKFNNIVNLYKSS